MMAQLELIVCMAKNHVIGLNGQIPWHFKADLQHFKAVTLGHPIVMGRRTFQSIGKALPGRRNLVVTSGTIEAPGVEVVRSLDEAVSLMGNAESLFVIGGQRLYQEALQRAAELNVTRLHLTRIDKEFAGDTYFPDFTALPCTMTASEQQHDAENDFDYTFETWAFTCI